MEKGKYITKTPQGEIDFCEKCPHAEPICGPNGCKEFLAYKKEQAMLAAKFKEKVENVKKDLRLLRKLTHTIEMSMELKSRHEKRLAYLRTRERENSEEIERMERLMREMRFDEDIAKATALEEKYMQIINRLESIEKTIILDGYINGKPYWKIGQGIGYSEEGVKKRVKKIIVKIVKLL